MPVNKAAKVASAEAQPAQGTARATRGRKPRQEKSQQAAAELTVDVDTAKAEEPACQAVQEVATPPLAVNPDTPAKVGEIFSLPKLMALQLEFLHSPENASV